MVNIGNERERKVRIDAVAAILKKLKKEAKEYDVEELLYQIMSLYGVTKKTAQEYVNVAFRR